jgi:hypothetical protein
MTVSRLGSLGTILTLIAVLQSGSRPIIARESSPGNRPSAIGHRPNAESRWPKAESRKSQAGFLIVQGEASQSKFGGLSNAGLSEESQIRPVNHAVPFYPQAGDVFLYDDLVPLHHLVFKLAGTGPPTHAAIAIERQDHQVALLELTGPSVISSKVAIMEVYPRLKSYEGNVMVRRVRQPLTEEQSAELTNFAVAQEGKYIAFKRGLLQGTPFRARSGLRRQLFARTYFDRKRWFCSEMVVAAACSCQLLDPHIYHANAMYPRDLAFDETYDLSALYHKALPWVAEQRKQ